MTARDTAPAGRVSDTSIDRYYRDAYQDVMYTGAVGAYSRVMHRLMERPFRGGYYPVILEVGSGAGQHVQYADCTWDEYWETDLNPDLQAQRDRVVHGQPVTHVRADAQDLSQFADGSVDRVIATCLLAHLPNPEAALQEWRRVLRPGGTVSIYIPSEPGMLLRLVRRVVMVPKSRKLGQDHLGTVFRDHRNHFPGMKVMIDSVFARDRINRRRYPMPGLGWNFSLFEIVHIVKS